MASRRRRARSGAPTAARRCAPGRPRRCPTREVGDGRIPLGDGFDADHGRDDVVGERGPRLDDGRQRGPGALRTVGGHLDRGRVIDTRRGGRAAELDLVAERGVLGGGGAGDTAPEAGARPRRSPAPRPRRARARRRCARHGRCPRASRGRRRAPSPATGSAGASGWRRSVRRGWPRGGSQHAVARVAQGADRPGSAAIADPHHQHRRGGHHHGPVAERQLARSVLPRLPDWRSHRRLIPTDRWPVLTGFHRRRPGEHERPYAGDYPGPVNEVVVTAIGADRPGIVAALSAALLDIGGNLEDGRAALLRGSFAITLAVAVPDGVEPEAVSARLAPVADALGLGISVQKADPKGAASTARRCIVQIYGADRPGIVATMAAALADNRRQHPRPERAPGRRPADLRAGHGGRDPRRPRARVHRRRRCARWPPATAWTCRSSSRSPRRSDPGRPEVPGPPPQAPRGRRRPRPGRRSTAWRATWRTPRARTRARWASPPPRSASCGASPGSTAPATQGARRPRPDVAGQPRAARARGRRGGARGLPQPARPDGQRAAGRADRGGGRRPRRAPPDDPHVRDSRRA